MCHLLGLAIFELQNRSKHCNITLFDLMDTCTSCNRKSSCRYDREIDAINEPYRPIPSGKISEGEVIAQIWILLIGGLAISYGLDKCAAPTVDEVHLHAHLLDDNDMQWSRRLSIHIQYRSNFEQCATGMCWVWGTSLLGM